MGSIYDPSYSKVLSFLLELLFNKFLPPNPLDLIIPIFKKIEKLEEHKENFEPSGFLREYSERDVGT